jgi:hypothetical protein
VVSNQIAQDGQAQNARIPARSSSLSSMPDPVGSFAPPLVTVPVVVPIRQHAAAVSDRLICARCGSNHLLEVCQDREPWEYIAPYHGSEEFGSGFYSIPAAELESPPLDQMNYAHITVEKGEVNCRDIEHEFDVWADSMKASKGMHVFPLQKMDHLVMHAPSTPT